ncbi:MAG: hypothetical protein J6M39_06120 [Lachnospiraceae bacterium]|nr:hypothetical protein [Lachnospiraceae bacterium]
MESINQNKENPYKAWGIFVIIMNIFAAIYYVISNKELIIAIDYYRANKDILNLVLVLSQFIILIFSLIEGLICIIASKNNKYILAAFILMIMDNIIYISLLIFTFDPTKTVAPVFWIGLRLYFIYLAFGVLKNNIITSNNKVNK